jgi:hypothetical protein
LPRLRILEVHCSGSIRELVDDVVDAAFRLGREETALVSSHEVIGDEPLALGFVPRIIDRLAEV